MALGLTVLAALAGEAYAQVDYGPVCSSASDHTLRGQAVDLGEGLVAQEISQFYGADLRRYGWMIANCKTSGELVIEVFSTQGSTADEGAEADLVTGRYQELRSGLEYLRAGSDETALAQIATLAESLGMPAAATRIAPDHCGCALYYPGLANNQEIVQ